MHTTKDNEACGNALFVGQYECKPGRKGGMYIPAEWRAVPGGGDLFAVRDKDEANAVCLFPEHEYERELRLSHGDGYLAEERDALSAAKRVHVDVRGRFRLPEEFAGLLGGHVALVGRVRTILACPFDESPCESEETLLESVLGELGE